MVQHSLNNCLVSGRAPLFSSGLMWAAGHGVVDKSGRVGRCPQNLLATLWASGGQTVESCLGPASDKGDFALPKNWAPRSDELPEVS
jgi:hypothetical protein